MKTKRIGIFAIILAILGCFLFALSFQTTFLSHADESESVGEIFTEGETVGGKENGFDFFMTMTANTRNGSAAYVKREQVTDTTENQTVEYLCLQWRDTKSLNFRVKAELDQSKTYLSYQLMVTYMRAEDLTAAIGKGNDESLTPASAITPSFDLDFTYFVDSTATSTAPNTAIGHGFGLYKFNFTYSYIPKNSTTQTSVGPISIGEIYVAIVPDDITKIEIPEGVRIQYSVHSSRKLLNAYDFGVNTNIFDYVNPDYLVWEVVGTDQDGNNYVYDKEMQRQEKFAGYDTIYPSDQPHTGTDFHFDSNDIPGEWEVSLKILNPDGSTRHTIPAVKVSTIKNPKKSHLWLILLLIVLALILLVIILIIIWAFKRKRERIW